MPQTLVRYHLLSFSSSLPTSFFSIAARTYPSTGTFSPAQAELYAALLSAQKSLCKLCTESSGHSLHELHRKSCELLQRELNQIGFGLQTGDLERILYPHFLSHPIGIDLHESSNFDRSGEWVVLSVTQMCIRSLLTLWKIESRYGDYNWTRYYH